MRYEALDVSNDKQYYAFLVLYWEYNARVHLEDLGRVTKFETPVGETECWEVEQSLYGYLRRGCEVQLAFKGDEMVGFMLYHNLYNCILVLMSMFVVDTHAKAGIGKGLVDSLPWGVSKVIFQTRKQNPPKFLLGVTSSHRTQIGESAHDFTWEMLWGGF